MKKVLSVSLALLFISGVSFANLDGKNGQKEATKTACCSKDGNKKDAKSCGDKSTAAKESCSKDDKKGDCCSKKSSKKAKKARKTTAKI